MPFTTKQLAIYFNGALVSREIFNSSIGAPMLNNTRVYGLDAVSRSLQEVFLTLLGYYTRESDSDMSDRLLSLQEVARLELELSACAFAVYGHGDRLVGFIYF